MKKIIKSLLTEYGINWTINRALYSTKIKMMSLMPLSDIVFEKNVNIKRINIFDFDVTKIKKFLRGLSEEKKEEIVSIADKAIAGIICGFSSIELDYGAPINWHLNPMTGVESRKDIKWYQIPDFDDERGDIKVVWEASRLTHFYYFVRAYLLTDDKKYYDAFSSQLENWLKNNPYPYGANFKCGQECTLRMINALIAYTVFEKCGITTDDDKNNVIRLVELCYKKVLSNFFYAHKCIKNNHTFSEICGLIVGAWCCDDMPGVKKAYKLLDKEIINQFQADGGFTQYSFNYHRFTLQIIECVFKISEKTKLKVTEIERIKNSVLLLYQVQNDNGDVPNYGSNDGALIFPVTSCSYRDFRPVLNTVYALIEGKRLYESGVYDEELLWFGEGKVLSRESVERKPSAFDDTGFYTLRHDEGFLMTCLQNYNSRPAHMDQLHFDLWHKGINVFCDNGTYSYASRLGKMLSSTAAHNTVKFQEIEQMNKNGAFLVTDWTKRKNVIIDNSSFRGTMISKNGYEHTRFIKRTDQGYLINDEITGDGDYCEFYFHTPCDVKIDNSGFKLYKNDQYICSVETSGVIENKNAFRSIYYLKKDEINCVTIKGFLVEKKCIMEFNVIFSSD
ncbi:heparinase II/III domain-containing protein [Lederbergia lenta]|uniref:Heparinase II/III n=1 Tax=Lederbergia lenta TaxID=1467 RepID=A0A2X4WT61_LEDLE|nr:heparinase II/III family protein [Lederbergia lenta]MEC2323154.1 heparinase II/III family protein [Lederbergia lenta]SQI62828.1 Heparinase II/III [Lederbergia lenta]